MNKRKLANTVNLGIILILVSGTIINFDGNPLIVNGNWRELDKTSIKNSGYWVLSNITINGAAEGIGAHNWTWAESQAWCQGSGTSLAPYIIENVTIDGGNLGSCIEIIDSNVFFEINNCTVYNSGSGSPPNNHAGIRFYNVTNGKLFENNCSNNGDTGIHLINSYNNTILNNTLNNNIEFGIKLRLSDNNQIMGSIVNNNGFGVVMDQSHYNQISENKVDNSILYGIYLGSSVNNTVLENTATNSLTAGIGLTTCNNTLISNNRCEKNEAEGISIWLSYFTNITENTLHNNTVYGIYLYSTNNNTISANNVTWNGQEGIKLDSSNDSIVVNNNLLNNRGCIQEVNCENNYFENNTCVIFDDVDPFLIVYSPQYYDIFGDTAPTFNITIVEDNLHSSWYILDDGFTNVWYPFNSSIGMINQTLWDAMQDGPISLTFNANDTHGNLGSVSLDVIKDITAPLIMIYSPSVNEGFGVNAPSYSISMYDPSLDSIWYTLDGGVNNITTISTNGAIDQSIWDAMVEGLINITFYANDTFGKIGFEIVPVYKDITTPIITINSPSQNVIIGEDAPFYSISIDEDNLDTIWYTLDGGINNITTTNTTGIIHQNIWDSLGNGNITIRFYSRDIAGNIGFQEVSVIKKAPPPGRPRIKGFEINILIGIFCIVSLIWVKKRIK